MYYIMQKSYYVMHKLLRYAKNVLRYAVIITLCGNYYVMRRHKRACLVGKADVVGLNELPPRWGQQIIDVYRRCQYISLRQAIVQHPP